MIPKIIHYCWFSNESFPVEVKICLDTWKRVLPDYKLRIWNLDDALSLKCNFVNEALKCKKWAFAADVVRIYALYTEGGVYMDCDIFLKKRFDDFVCGDFATFCECPIDDFLIETERKEGKEVPFGLQAAFMIGAKNNHFCKLILDYYYSHSFTRCNAKMDMRVAPYIYAEVAESLGFKYINKKQELSYDTFVFDSKFRLSLKSCVYANNFINLYRKKLISLTPLNCALKAFILALKDSAEALVLLLSK